MNDLLQRLDYSVVSDAWGSGATAPGDLAVSRACNARSGDAAYADLRVLEGHEVLWRQVIDLASPEWVRDEGDDAGRVEDPSRGSSFVVAVERDTLRELYHGRGNVGTALQSRTLRYYGPLPIHFNDERAVFERVHAFFATVRQELLPLTGA